MNLLDDDARYGAIRARDRRFDGVFYVAVASTGIYCRPSCPARTPARANVSFHPSAAAAQRAGYRACKRCLPDATPNSPEWDVAADAAGRAMRLIADGVVERVGVAGLAERIGYSERHLNRIMLVAYGAGPLALARARRAQTARTLIEAGDLSMAEVAFASGFASVRQFNDTVRAVYGATPSELRTRVRRTSPLGAIDVRVAVREPFDGQRLYDFLAHRALPRLEAAADGRYERTLRLPHGSGVLQLSLTNRPAGVVPCRFWLSDTRDLAPAMERARRLLDADADPVAIDTALASDPRLRPSVVARPGMRVPGEVDGFEAVVRAVLGQQVSVSGATRLKERVVARRGSDLGISGHAVDRLFPRPEDMLDIADDAEPWGMPGARVRALQGIARAVASGEVRLDRSAGRDETYARLLALPGVGPWTADYALMRGLAAPDVFLPTDAGVRRGAETLGLDGSPRAIAMAADAWRPWRSYALIHLWENA